MKIRAKKFFISSESGNVDVGQVLNLSDGYAKHLIENGFAEGISSAPVPVSSVKIKRKKGAVWLIAASGPSLTEADAEKIRDWRTANTKEKRQVAVINTTFKLMPWADVLYACDLEWWDEYITKVKDIFWGELWTQCPNAEKKHNLNRAAGENKPGLAKNGLIHFGGNSGYQTINLAYNMGASKIILVGFDMQRTDGKSHHHGDHPGRLNKGLPFGSWLKNFDKLAEDLRAEGVQVINATRSTALNSFQKKTLEEALCV